MKHLVAPSVLACDFGKLHQQIELINGSEADWFHVDIMDGNFVPNISFGPAIVSSIKEVATLPLDVHLMIADPDKYIADYVKAGADVITVHIEACPHLHRSIQYIKSLGVKAGVAVNPHTPVESVFEVLEDLDLVCLMSVNPGFGGQKFIYNTLSKIQRLNTEITGRNLPTLIEIDGGVGLQNAEKILQYGADVLVAGSSVYNAPDPIDAVKRLKALSRHNLLD